MKTQINYFLKLCIIITTVNLITGCGSAKKVPHPKNEIKITEENLVTIKNDIVIDSYSNLTWKYYHDNPTTLIRFQINENKQRWRIPEVSELSGLLKIISAQLNNKKYKKLIESSDLFESEKNFLSSEFYFTPEGDKRYKTINWDPSTKTISDGYVTEGDIVTILLIEKK